MLKAQTDNSVPLALLELDAVRIIVIGVERVCDCASSLLQHP